MSEGGRPAASAAAAAAAAASAEGGRGPGRAAVARGGDGEPRGDAPAVEGGVGLVGARAAVAADHRELRLAGVAGDPEGSE